MTILTLSADQRAVHAAYVEVADAVRSGRLAVIPTDTCYAVIGDAFNAGAVAAMHEARGQDPDVPLPVGVGSLETAHGVAQFGGLALDLATQVWPGPLTLLTRPQTSLSWQVGPADAALAIRVPAHAAAIGVLERTGPVIMTNAARAGEPAARSVQAAVDSLGESVAVYLDAGELPGTQSSIVDASGDNLRLVREGVLTLAALRDVVPMLVRATS